MSVEGPSNDNPGGGAILRGSIILVVLLMCAISLHLFSAPDPAPSGAPATEFSAVRAMDHVRAICKSPRPIGTPEHRRVRDTIVAETRRIGLETEVHEAVASRPRPWGLQVAMVQNVVSVLEGTDGDPAVLIVGHYDSEPHTLGAADDGSAVAAMLEAARALAHQPRLRNDLVFLFTDAEEIGMVGARAFVQDHPLARRVGIVLNLEARGNAGPSLIIDVSPGNDRIVREIRRALPRRLYADSLLYEISRLASGRTDFSVFKEEGISGFDAAFLDGYANYHGMTDSPETLDLGSLQHQGSLIMGVACHFGSRPLEEMAGGDAVFFNPIGGWLLVYPRWMNITLVAAAAGMFVVYLLLGIRRGRISITGAVGGLVIVLVTISSAAVMIWLLESAVRFLYPHYAHFEWDNYYNSRFYFAAFGALAIALYSWIYYALFAWTKWEDLMAGMLAYGLFWSILLLFILPTGAYVHAYPLLFVLAAWLVCLAFGGSEERRPVVFAIVLLLAALPVIAFSTPLIASAFVIGGLRFAWVGAAGLLEFLGYLMPQLRATYHLHRRALPRIALLIGFAFLLAGHFTSGHGADRPLRSHLAYCLDADSETALWISNHLRTDDWNRQFFTDPVRGPLTEFYPAARKVRLKNDAPVVAVPAPQLRTLRDETEEGVRVLRLRLVSARQAPTLRISIPRSANISALAVNEKPMAMSDFPESPSSDRYLITIHGVDEEGVDVEIHCDPGRPLEMIVIEKKLGLPEVGGFVPMPAGVVPSSAGDSSVSLVKKTFRI